MSRIDTLTNNLASGDIGQLCMINFVDSAACKVIDRTLTKNFLVTWADAAYGLQTLDEVLGIIRPIKEADPKYQSNSGIPIQLTVESMFTVMEYEYIRGHLSDETLASELALAEDIYTDYLRSDSFDWTDLEMQLKNIGPQNATFAKGKGLKRSSRNTVWLSTTRPGEPLNEEICYSSSGESEADTARDNLGLVHIALKPGDPPPILVAIEINRSDIPSSPGIWRPTQIDAGEHTRFRGAFGDLRKNAIGWGRAINLRKLSDRNGELGAPESVTLNFQPKSARFWFLGYPRLKVNDASEIKDKKFVRNISRGRFFSSTRTSSSSNITRRFLALCR